MSDETSQLAEIDALKSALRSADRAFQLEGELLLALQKNLHRVRELFETGRKRGSRELLGDTISLLDEYLKTANHAAAKLAVASVLGGKDG